MNFIVWYYTAGLAKFISIWKDLLTFFPWYFAISWHFRTLFSAWKRDISRVEGPGFHPALWLQNAIVNGATRFIGAIIRSALILGGILVEIATLFLGIFLIFEWLVWPFFLLLLAGMAPFFFSMSLSEKIFFGILAFSLLWIFQFSLKLFREEKRNYSQMNLEELMKQSWFGRVWKRIGEDPTGQTTLFDGYFPEALNKFLGSCQITLQDFQEIVSFELANQIEEENKKRWWLKENLYSHPPIGKNWVYAYTVTLDKYSTDLSESDPTEYEKARLVSHERELSLLELILSRPNQNSVFIVGETGVGKHTLVHTLAKEIRENLVDPALYNKRVLEIHLGEFLSATSGGKNADYLLRKVFFEAAYAGNIILVIDDIDQYLKASPQSSQEDISEVLLEFLNFPTFQVIGITTPENFHNEIEKKERLIKFFEKIQMGEIKKEEVMPVLFNKLKEIEKGEVIFTYLALKEIIKLSDRYIMDTPFPEKALDLMEEVFLFWSRSSASKMITAQVVDRVVSQKINISIGEISKDEKEKLVHLEEIMHQRVIGQDLAIRQIAETMRRARVGMASENKPIGSFLFLGPTGVGKTESAKALAEVYFGDEKRMIRLDMSEYQKADSIDRLIGSTESGKPGILENKVRENPYSLLLLDEIEKAYPTVLDLFLQILDEGWLTDAFGKKIDFRNQIIIATSNAGSEIIKEAVEAKTKPEDIQKKVIDYVIKEGIFRTEFLNRFEGVIFFHPLDQNDLRAVTKLILEKYAARLKKEKNITIDFDPEVILKIIQEAYDPIFGARAINRYIEDKIGDKIVKKIITEEIKEGEKLFFSAKDLS